MAGIIPSLDVGWHTGEPVGKVVNPGTLAFGYLPEWLDRGASLSPLVVPFSNELHRLRDDAFDQLPGFLADALPDSWGRTVMSREFAAANVEATPLHMLAWVGKRGLGSLRFQPAVTDEASSDSWGAVEPILLAREAQEVLRNAPPESYIHLRRAGTAGGAFPKATVALLPDQTLLCGGDVVAVMDRYSEAKLGILKLDVEDDPTRPSTDGRLEAAYLTMAKAAGIQVPNHEVISHDDHDRPRHHLFVERFDVLDGGKKRLHLLSLAGAMETFRLLDYPRLFDTTRRLTEDNTQLIEAVRRMIFNVRAANADDHGKNHAFTFDREHSRWSLSPAYDLTLNYSPSSTFNGLFPQTFGNSPRLDRMADVSADFGIPHNQFAEIDAQVASAVQRWPEFAEQHAVPGKDIERARKQHEHILVVLDAKDHRHRSTKRRRRW